MILIAYDGTPCAAHAITVAATLLGAVRAHVVYVWEAAASPLDAVAHIDYVGRQEREARDIAAAGIALARAAGFRADGEAIRLDDPAAALEDLIDRVRPELVVVGSRGRTGLRALLDGSVSRDVGAHAHAPVLIVPQAADSPSRLAPGRPGTH